MKIRPDFTIKIEIIGLRNEKYVSKSMGSKKISERKDSDLDLNKYFSNLKLKDEFSEAINLIGKEFDFKSGGISFLNFQNLFFLLS